MSTASVEHIGICVGERFVGVGNFGGALLDTTSTELGIRLLDLDTLKFPSRNIDYFLRIGVPRHACILPITLA